MDIQPRLLLVEDDQRMAAVITAILRASGFDDVVTVRTVAAARAALARSLVDAFLVDLGLPDGDGLELIVELRAGSSTLPILVLTACSEHERIVTALRSGANGFLFKDDLDVRLGRGLRELLAGNAPLSAGAAKALLNEWRGATAAVPAPVLTARQGEVLSLLATGAGYAEIARELRIGINTVRTHVMSLYEQMGVENRAEAVNLAWRFGLLQHSA